MKSTSTILHGAALLACATAQDAFIWTTDLNAAEHSNHQALSISSVTASAIIARRRGVTEDRYLRTTEQDALSNINKFGGYQRPLFDAGTGHAPGKILIRISGFDGKLSEFTSIPDLVVDSPSYDLLDGFKARKSDGVTCEYNLSIPAKSNIDIVYSYYSDGASCKSVAEVEMQPAISTLYSATPSAKDVGQDSMVLLRAMNDIRAMHDIESTFLVLPVTSALRKTRSRRSAQAEEPLDLPDADSETSSDSLGALQQANSSHPLPKIIPQCFTSESTCNNVTNSCSGHGSCYKAHASCFKCKCGTTVLRRETGKKTIQWGGNACQKKDVSMPFALFATYGVVMTAMVAGGIGMLYSMGAQELPSVLGAGVSGPKASK